MRKRVFENMAIAILLVATGSSFGQTPETGTTQTDTTQSRVVGIVTAVDKTANQITIKSETGESLIISTGDSPALLRLPTGETSAQKAVKITLGDIAVGDRVFARGTATANGKSLEARQVVVTSVAVSATAEDQQRQREDFRQRGLMGRIIALDPGKKEITVQSRSREGIAPIKVSVSDSARFFRYAPDSLDIKNASRSTFAELRVGDQLRALGNRSADGTRFTAEEVIAGSIARTGGQVVAVDPAKNELTVKNDKGQTFIVAVGSRSSLRRVTPEVAASFEANRRARPAAGAGQGGQERRPRERRDRASGATDGERRPRGGRGFQDVLEGLPAITINDLKKGDTVFVSGSESSDPARLTAITLVTGDPAFVNRLMQTGPNRGPQNPGLPGDVLGGGVGSAERPTSP